MSVLKLLSGILKDIVAPPCCCHCQLSGSFLCLNCYEQLELLLTSKIELPSTSSLDNLICLGEFTGPLKSLILNLKYKGQIEISSTLAELLFHLVVIPPIDLVTTVPPHKERVALRGFSQSEYLAKNLSLLTQIPFKNTLCRSKHLTPQASIKNKDERLHRQQNTMTVLPSQLTLLTDQQLTKILIVDDVYTTGATLNEAARALKSVNPNLNVTGLALARA